jgi:hypothetical protein
MDLKRHKFYTAEKNSGDWGRGEAEERSRLFSNRLTAEHTERLGATRDRGWVLSSPSVKSLVMALVPRSVIVPMPDGPPDWQNSADPFILFPS